MTSVTFADPWLEGSVAMEKEAVTQMEELNRSLTGQSSSWSSNLDDSLTSLCWLQEFSMSSASRAQHTSSHQPGASTSPSAGDLASIGLSQTGSKHTAASYSRPPPPKRVSRGQCLEEVDFSTRNIRPSFSYANLIHLAMLPKITLACINKWITDNFCYYRHADPT